MWKPVLSLLLLSYCWWVPVTAAPSVSLTPKTRTLAFLTPHKPGDSFWGLMEAFMLAACNDLGMKLIVYYAEDDTAKMKAQLQDAIRRKVDGLVYQNFNQTGVEMLKIAEQAKIPSILIDTGLDEADQQKIGGPREQMRYWLGDFLPENEEAGYDLAQSLLKQAAARFSQRPLQVVAIAGDPLSNASIDRVRGLQIAMQDTPWALLQELLPGYWSGDKAQSRAMQSWQKHPGQMQIIWGANDPSALGAAETLRKKGLRPGYDVLLGGVDWTLEGLLAVQRGELSASVGGHFMLGGWAAVLLYDWYQNYDFAQESVNMRLRMDVLTKQNIGPYLSFFGKGNFERIDFARFSKARNKQLRKYNFGLQALLEQVR